MFPDLPHVARLRHAPSTRRSPPRRRPTHCPRSCANGASAATASTACRSSGRASRCRPRGWWSATSAAAAPSRLSATVAPWTRRWASPRSKAYRWRPARARSIPARSSTCCASHLTLDALDHALEHESGLAGLSGLSGDVRELERRRRAGRPAGARGLRLSGRHGRGRHGGRARRARRTRPHRRDRRELGKPATGHLRPPRLSRCRARSRSQCVGSPGRHHLYLREHRASRRSGSP